MIFQQVQEKISLSFGVNLPKEKRQRKYQRFRYGEPILCEATAAVTIREEKHWDREYVVFGEGKTNENFLLSNNNVSYRCQSSVTLGSALHLLGKPGIPCLVFSNWSAAAFVGQRSPKSMEVSGSQIADTWSVDIQTIFKTNGLQAWSIRIWSKPVHLLSCFFPFSLPI